MEPTDFSFLVAYSTNRFNIVCETKIVFRGLIHSYHAPAWGNMQNNQSNNALFHSPI